MSKIRSIGILFLCAVPLGLLCAFFYLLYKDALLQTRLNDHAPYYWQLMHKTGTSPSELLIIALLGFVGFLLLAIVGWVILGKGSPRGEAGVSDSGIGLPQIVLWLLLAGCTVGVFAVMTRGYH